MVSMVCVGKMGVHVRYRLMPVKMDVLCARWHWKFVIVLMMFVMGVLVAVLHHLVGMFMLMPLGQMQPDT